MKLFSRNDGLLKAAKVRHWAPKDGALTPHAQYEKWLQSIPPSVCAQHPQTGLLLVREKVWEHSSLDSYDVGYWWFMDGEDKPPRETLESCYPFEARFVCPACKVRYAKAPQEFEQSAFDGYLTESRQQADNLAKCRDFVQQVNMRGHGFLLMVGMNGTGKTRLSCNIIREMKCPDSLYVRQGELTLALRSTYGLKQVVVNRRVDEESEAGDSPILVPQNVNLLVLDEIGCNASANDERLALDELIKHRYDERKATILISNLKLQDLKAFVGDALADRINHAAGNGRFVLQFSDPSYRRAAGENYLA